MCGKFCLFAIEYGESEIALQRSVNVNCIGNVGEKLCKALTFYVMGVFIGW